MLSGQRLVILDGELVRVRNGCVVMRVLAVAAFCVVVVVDVMWRGEMQCISLSTLSAARCAMRMLGVDETRNV